MKKAYIDQLFQVGEEGEPPLTVRPSPDDPQAWVELCAVGTEAVDYWGEISVMLPNEIARLLGQALIKAATKEEGK